MLWRPHHQGPSKSVDMHAYGIDHFKLVSTDALKA